MTTISLDYQPRVWQYHAHERRRRFTVLVLHRRGGKTEWVLRELLNAAMETALPLATFGYLAPLRTQAKSIAWARLKTIVKPLADTGHIELNESDLSVKILANGAIVRLFGADNVDAIRGLRFDGLALDEVAQMKVDLWDSVLLPALADRQGFAVFIGTVKGVDLFSILWYRALALMGQRHPDWWAGLWTVYETDALPQAEIELLKASMSDRAFAREMLCDFTVQGDDQLIGVADVMRAADRRYKPMDLAHMPRTMGVDPARFGDDRSVIVKRQGLGMLEPVILRDMDQMDLAARVAFEMQDFLPDAVFIDAGLGAGVIDRLRQMGHDVMEIPFGGVAMKPARFVNRRTEMWWAVREWITAGGSIPKDLSLQQELSTPTYSFSVKGQIELESKDDIRKRLPEAGSPDIADALALTFAAPVAARRHRAPELWPRPGVPAGEEWRNQGRDKRKGYNPFSREERDRRRRG